jgi:L-methionine (R)-S-oxide reductase
MSEELIIDKSSSREEKYKSLVPQIQALIQGESDLIANMANISAALKEVFSFWWVGFYLVKEQELVLGPFQGPVACTRIAYAKGVCGTSWKEEKTLIVPDVDQFPGHIACSSASRSEIVIPVFKDDKIIAVLDVDSEHLNHFDELDEKYLKQILQLLS